MTAYEKAVRHALIDHEMSIGQLAKLVSDKTGLFCDTAYLGRNLSGERNAPKIKAAVNEILGIEGDFNATG